jgi:ribosomal protein L34E
MIALKSGRVGTLHSVEGEGRSTCSEGRENLNHLDAAYHALELLPRLTPIDEEGARYYSAASGQLLRVAAAAFPHVILNLLFAIQSDKECIFCVSRCEVDKIAAILIEARWGSYTRVLRSDGWEVVQGRCANITINRADDSTSCFLVNEPFHEHSYLSQVLHYTDKSAKAAYQQWEATFLRYTYKIRQALHQCEVCGAPLNGMPRLFFKSRHRVCTPEFSNFGGITGYCFVCPRGHGELLDRRTERSCAVCGYSVQLDCTKARE